LTDIIAKLGSEIETNNRLIDMYVDRLKEIATRLEELERIITDLEDAVATN
jgi:hypothetical protein